MSVSDLRRVGLKKKMSAGAGRVSVDDRQRLIEARCRCVGVGPPVGLWVQLRGDALGLVSFDFFY